MFRGASPEGTVLCKAAPAREHLPKLKAGRRPGSPQRTPTRGARRNLETWPWSLTLAARTGPGPGPDRARTGPGSNPGPGPGQAPARARVPYRKMSNIVRKLSEMCPEKWSRSLQTSEKSKISLQIHWKASQRPKTLSKNKEIRKTMKF